MKKYILIAFILFILLPFQNQSEEYRLGVNKSFGYNNAERIRGSFRLDITGDQTQVASVSFQVDGQEIALVNAAPFKTSLNTDAYPAGAHQLSAVVTTLDGRSISTPERTFRFLSAEEESVDMRGLLGPMLGLIAAIFVIGVLSQTVLMRRRKPLNLAPGAPRQYGFKGGSICPRCKRPFGLHFWSINLAVGVYDRCDFCGKWALYRRRSSAELAAAEAAEVIDLQPRPQTAEKSEEEKLREMLDDSKYTRG